jgi:hypothetical protein
MQNHYRIEMAEGGNSHAAVASVWRGGGMSDDAILNNINARLDWLYGTGNPFGPTRTWLLKTGDSNDAVGVASIVPREIRVDGVNRRAGVLADFVVLPKHRSAGPAVLLQRSVAEGSASAGFELTFGYPNAKAWPILARVGYKAVATATPWFGAVRTRQKLAKFISAKLESRLTAERASTCANLVAAASSGLADRGLFWFRRQALWRAARRFRYETLDRADERFDTLLEAAPSRIVPIRSADFLNWRYTAHPTVRYKFFAIFSGASDKLEGYAIYSVGPGNVCLQDIVGGEPFILELLLMGVAAAAYRERAELVTVSYVGKRSIPEALERVHFVQRQDNRRLIVQCRLLADEEAKTVLAPDNWALMDGELDI